MTWYPCTYHSGIYRARSYFSFSGLTMFPPKKDTYAWCFFVKFSVVCHLNKAGIYPPRMFMALLQLHFWKMDSLIFWTRLHILCITFFCLYSSMSSFNDITCWAYNLCLRKENKCNCFHSKLAGSPWPLTSTTSVPEVKNRLFVLLYIVRVITA